MRTWFFGAALAALAALWSLPALSLSLADSSSTVGEKRTRVSGVFSASEIRYEFDDIDRDVDRKIIGAELSRGVAASVDLFGQLGMITSTEVDTLDSNGSGYVIGFGARGQVYKKERLAVLIDGLYTYQHE